MLRNQDTMTMTDLGDSEKAPSAASTSIIIPCYNYGRFLADAIESALAQTRAAVEIIVVNDGSSDNTASVATQYRVSIITQTNLGVASARNTGIKHASGEYILPLDADDRIHPEFLEKTVPILEAEPKTGVVFTHRRHFGTSDSVKEAPIFSLEQMTLKCTHNYCSLYRRKLWEECGGYDEAMKDGYEDWDLWLSAAEKRWEFRLLPEILFLYRKHGHSLSDVARSKHECLMLRLKEKHPRLFPRPFAYGM